MSQENDIEDAYRAAMAQELGHIIEATREITPAVFEGKQAFSLMIHCVIPDVPPPCSLISMDTSGHDRFYRLKIMGLDHDTLMKILVSLKDIIPVSDETPKKSSIVDELKSMGIGYMGKYILSHRDKTFTLDIRYMSQMMTTKICKVLFSW